jgi:teichuronic acid biosynthesis glycosyltransferase TuaH
MNIDWRWIKQRPHFIAEGLSKKYDVVITYPYNYDRKNLQKSAINAKNIIPLKGKRYLNKNKLFRFINRMIISIKQKKIIEEVNPQILYVTAPWQYPSIPKKYKGKIIYDCMDDQAEFYKNKLKRKSIQIQEEKLIKKADVVISSANNLKNKLETKYNVDDNKIVVVRNGFNGHILNTKEIKKKTSNYNVYYFGTISEWFNFDYLLKSLNDFPNLEYFLIGPKDTEIPKNNRIHYMGIIEHDKLYETTNEADCFIMPFKLNQLIESVDPVKLYEYINFGKNILSVKYAEIERFNKFVHFYTNYEEFKNELYEMMSSNQIKYSQKEKEEFLKNNMWNNRVEKISELIENC